MRACAWYWHAAHARFHGRCSPPAECCSHSFTPCLAQKPRPAAHCFAAISATPYLRPLSPGRSTGWTRQFGAQEWLTKRAMLPAGVEGHGLHRINALQGTPAQSHATVDGRGGSTQGAGQLARDPPLAAQPPPGRAAAAPHRCAARRSPSARRPARIRAAAVAAGPCVRERCLGPGASAGQRNRCREHASRAAWSSAAHARVGSVGEWRHATWQAWAWVKSRRLCAHISGCRQRREHWRAPHPPTQSAPGQTGRRRRRAAHPALSQVGRCASARCSPQSVQQRLAPRQAGTRDAGQRAGQGRWLLLIRQPAPWLGPCTGRVGCPRLRSPPLRW